MPAWNPFKPSDLLIALLVPLVAYATARATDGLAQGGETVVTVQTVEYRFLPADLHFRVGTLYRLHLENAGKEMHEFTAPAFLAAVDMQTPQSLVPAGNEVLLQPGEQKDVLFMPRAPGHYGLICADHDWAGMIGEIVIE